MGVPMDLNFEMFETAVLFISVLVVAYMVLVCPFIASATLARFLIIIFNIGQSVSW